MLTLTVLLTMISAGNAVKSGKAQIAEPAETVTESQHIVDEPLMLVAAQDDVVVVVLVAAQSVGNTVVQLEFDPAGGHDTVAITPDRVEQEPDDVLDGVAECGLRLDFGVGVESLPSPPSFEPLFDGQLPKISSSKIWTHGTFGSCSWSDGRFGRPNTITGNSSDPPARTRPVLADPVLEIVVHPSVEATLEGSVTKKAPGGSDVIVVAGEAVATLYRDPLPRLDVELEGILEELVVVVEYPRAPLKDDPDGTTLVVSLFNGDCKEAVVDVDIELVEAGGSSTPEEA